MKSVNNNQVVSNKNGKCFIAQYDSFSRRIEWAISRLSTMIFSNRNLSLKIEYFILR